MDRRSLAALGLTGLAAAALTTPSLAQESKSMPRLISLNGHGEVKAKPDMAVVNVGVATQAKTAREALTENTQAMEKIFCQPQIRRHRGQGHSDLEFHGQSAL